MNILVILSMGLGDLVFSIPVIKTLKRHYPKASLTFYTHRQNENLLSLIPEVDRVVSYTKFFPSILKSIVEVRKQPYQMAIVLNPIFRGAIIARLSGAPVRIGYWHDYEKKQSMHGLENLLLTHPYAPAPKKMHEVERYLDLLRLHELSVHPEDAAPRLKLAGMTQKRVTLESSSRGPLIIINPGAAWELRRWPADRFAKTADALAESMKARIVFVGGNQEREWVRSIMQQMKHIAEDESGKWSLVELTHRIAQADLFLTNDTGAMHIAAALDVPVLALFGPGDPEKVRPLCSKAQILYHQVPCSPCKVQYTDLCKNNICMQEISVEEVLDAAKRMLR